MKLLNPKYIILETNSAPALGEIGIEKYKDGLTQDIAFKLLYYLTTKKN